MSVTSLRARQQGLSIIELMISMGIGLLILAGLVTMFVNSSANQRELQRSSIRIENGRYAMDTITQDLHHAGYYGQYFLNSVPTAAQDPCALTAFADVVAAARFPIQAYAAASATARPDLSATTCATSTSPTNILSTANLSLGNDVLVVRRANTTALVAGNVAVTNEIYVQSNPLEIAYQQGSNTTIVTAMPTSSTANTTADGGIATIQNALRTAAAEIRKLHVHIYFVAPCSRPTGGGNVCTGSSDDEGSPIPTLKRLELGVDGGLRKFDVVSIAEGIEHFQVAYGLDSDPTTVNTVTNFKGDGVPETYVRAPTIAEHADIVDAQVSLLARNNDKTQGFTDTKTYLVGSLSVGPFNDQYKRHVFNSRIRMTNLSSRREIPR